MNETPRQRHIRLLKLLAESPKPLHFGPRGDDPPEDIRAVYELMGGGLCEGVPQYNEKGELAEIFHATTNLRGRTQLAEWEKTEKPPASEEPQWGKGIIHWGKIAGAVVAISAAATLVVGAVVYFLK